MRHTKWSVQFVKINFAISLGAFESRILFYLIFDASIHGDTDVAIEIRAFLPSVNALMLAFGVDGPLEWREKVNDILWSTFSWEVIVYIFNTWGFHLFEVQQIEFSRKKIDLKSGTAPGEILSVNI